MFNENKRHEQFEANLISCSRIAKEGYKKNSVLTLIYIILSVVLALWLVPYYPGAIWIFSVSVLINLFMLFVYQRAIHTAVIISQEGISQKRFGIITKQFDMEELVYIGKAVVKQSPLDHETSVLVFSKNRPKCIDDSRRVYSFDLKQSIFVEDNIENLTLVRKNCRNVIIEA